MMQFLYLLGNLLLLPIYTLIVLFPNRTLTRRVMRSGWPVAVPALLTVAVGLGFLASEPSALPRFGALLSQALGGQGFAALLRLLAEFPQAALVLWLHATAADAIMARWAYLESQELRLPVLPTSVALLCMGTNGPLGFLLYLLVRAWGRRRVGRAAPEQGG